MGFSDTARRLPAAARKALRRLARPVRAVQGQGGVVLQPYRGYGSRAELFLIGRVFRQPAPSERLPEDSLGRALADLGRRLLRHGISDAKLMARFYGVEERVTTDRDGYF